MSASSPAMEPAAVLDASCGAARRQSDEACKKPAGWGTDHVGYGRCRLHGGNTESHRKHHLRVIESLVPDAIGQLQRLVLDGDVPDVVKLRAAQDILDRAGLAPRQTLDVTGDLTLSVEVRQSQLLERARALRAGEVIDTTIAADESGDDE